MRNVDEIFNALAKSRFRSRFRLGDTELKYTKDKGIDTVVEHARDFVMKRLAEAEPDNDGRQTPFKGHPVFIAQHATATCCRKCLAKWHRIETGQKLTDEQVDYVVEVIRRWIEMQISSE